MLIIVNCPLQQPSIGIKPAKLEVVHRQFRMKPKVQIRQISCVCLGVFVSGLNTATYASPEIGLPARLSAKLQIGVLRARACWDKGPCAETLARSPLRFHVSVG